MSKIRTVTKLSGSAQGTKAKSPGGHTDPDVLGEIENLATMTDLKPSQIMHALQRQTIYAGRLPGLRTFQKIVKVKRKDDPSAPWDLAHAAADDAALVLPVLAAVIQASGRSHVTQAEARWISRIRRAVPDLRPQFVVYELARFYLSYESRGAPTDILDALLAFAPWRSAIAWERYQMAAAQGWVKRPALPWALYADYKDGLRRMGFFSMTVEEAGSYGELLELERQGGVEP